MFISLCNPKTLRSSLSRANQLLLYSTHYSFQKKNPVTKYILSPSGVITSGDIADSPVMEQMDN